MSINKIHLDAVQFQQLLSLGMSNLGSGIVYSIEDFSTIQNGKVVSGELRRSIKLGGIDFVLGEGTC